MSSATAYPQAPDLSPDDYVLVGLATCFVRDEGEVREVQVLEPMPSATALALINSNSPTSYRVAYGTTLGAILQDQAGQGLQPQSLDQFPSGSQFCADFVERAFAASRTHRRDRSVADRIPVGNTYEDFHYSTERKRLLNAVHTVRAEDNVKQHAYTHQVL
jgi:hypothetical protein